MKNLWTSILALWNKLTPKQRQWLKGAEAAVTAAVIAACVAIPASDLHTASGIGKCIAGVAASAYGALRLYITQSPVPVTTKHVVETETQSVGDVSVSTSKSETTISGGTPSTAVDAAKNQIAPTLPTQK